MTIARMRNLACRILVGCLGLAAAPAAAQEPEGTAVDSLRWKIEALERQVDDLEREVRSAREDSRELLESGDAAAGLLVAILLFSIAVFCAMWAQSVGRSGFVWFFLGLFLHVFAVMAVLIISGRRRARWSSA